MARKDPDFQAAEVMAEALTKSLADLLVDRGSEGAPLGGRVLIVGDPTGFVGQSLSSEVSNWQRRAGLGMPATAGPDEGPFETAVVRMPKSTEELKFTLALAAQRLSPSGKLFVFGSNDEGIKSAAKGFFPYFEKPTSVMAKRHCRVWFANPASDAAAPDLTSYKEVVRVETNVGALQWVSWPGMFAHRRLDGGSAFLIDHLPELKPGARVLDYGCGAGVLSLALRRTAERPDLTLFDNDALALKTALENVPGAEGVLGSSLSDLETQGFDLILSNPPIHTGKAQTYAILERLIGEAPAHLNPGGRLRIVVQGTVPAGRLMEAAFKASAPIAENRSFMIWEGTV
jgi:16S rRNA (guanine1207-N2)-methyltransferase